MKTSDIKKPRITFADILEAIKEFRKYSSSKNLTKEQVSYLDEYFKPVGSFNDICLFKSAVENIGFRFGYPDL